jgi:hypothetical protein
MWSRVEVEVDKGCGACLVSRAVARTRREFNPSKRHLKFNLLLTLSSRKFPGNEKPVTTHQRDRRSRDARYMGWTSSRGIGHGPHAKFITNGPLCSPLRCLNFKPCSPLGAHPLSSSQRCNVSICQTLSNDGAGFRMQRKAAGSA